MPATVIVTGLAQLQRDLAKSGPAVDKAMRLGLRAAAEPVSKIAEENSLKNIRRMRRSPAWAVNRISVTRNAVFIVPKKRGVKPPDPKGRRNLVDLMLTRSYDPAVDEGEPIVEASVIKLLGEVTSF